MTESTIASFECQIVEREYKLIGECVTANFPEGFPEAATKIQERFLARDDVAQFADNTDAMICPYMCNEIFATYFACFEVSSLEDIPDGMLGFTLPRVKYAKISCSNETIASPGHEKLYQWMSENGFQERAPYYSTPIEIYYFDDTSIEAPAELLIPVK